MARKSIVIVFLFLILALLLPGQHVLGQEDELKKAETLDRQADKLYQEDRYSEPIPLAREALAIREKVQGPEHPDTATALTNLAWLYELKT